MKKITAIVFGFCIGLFLSACNNEDEYVVPANEIVNLTFTTTPEGVVLNWDYEEDTEDNRNRYVEIRYYDPVTETDVLKTVSGYVDAFSIKKPLEGSEYTFNLQPFSETFTAGKIQIIKGIAESKNNEPDSPDEPDNPDEPEVEETLTVVSSKKLDITVSNIAILTDDGEDKISPDIYKNQLLDGNAGTYAHPWKSLDGDIKFNIHVTYPKPQRFLKFSYQNIGWNSNRMIEELECYIKVNESDEWTLVKTLTAEDGLKAEKGVVFESEPIQAPFEFGFIKLRATKVKQTGTPDFKVGFIISEFSVFDVEYKVETTNK